MIFGNSTIALHLARGVIGFGALAVAITNQHAPWLSVALLPVALVALKGCPMCWTMGLVETVAMRIHTRAAQCASAQLRPIPVSTVNGTLSEAAPSMM